MLLLVKLLAHALDGGPNRTTIHRDCHRHQLAIDVRIQLSRCGYLRGYLLLLLCNLWLLNNRSGPLCIGGSDLMQLMG